MTRKTRFIALATIASIGSAWGFFLYLRSLHAPEQYLAASASIGDLEESVLATGTLHPVKQVAIGAQVSGQVKTILVKPGDHVKEGQLLAEIDPVLQQNALRTAQSQLASARAQRDAKRALLRQYRAELGRQTYMLENDASSRANYEVARANVDTTSADIASAEAQVVVSRIQVDNARAQLSYTRINAPMDGEVIAMVARPGQTVVSSQIVPVLMILGNTDTMTVRARISEADILRVKLGQPVRFSVLGEPDKAYTSRVRTIEPAPESIVNESMPQQYQQSNSDTASAVYYNGLFDVPNPAHTLRTSMTAQVSIVLGHAAQTLTIPRAALGRHLGDTRYEIRVLDADQHAQKRGIRVGLMSDTSVQVTSGLSAGERVVVGEPAAPAQTSSATRPDGQSNDA